MAVGVSNQGELLLAPIRKWCGGRNQKHYHRQNAPLYSCLCADSTMPAHSARSPGKFSSEPFVRFVYERAIFAALQAENLPVSLMNPWGSIDNAPALAYADFFCVPATVTQLTRILELCRQYQVRTYLLGNGSNTLVFGCRVRRGGYLPDGVKPYLRRPSGWRGNYSWLHGMMLSALCNTALKESPVGWNAASHSRHGGRPKSRTRALMAEKIKDVLEQPNDVLDETCICKLLPAQELVAVIVSAFLSGAPGTLEAETPPCTCDAQRSIPP